MRQLLLPVYLKKNYCRLLSLCVLLFLFGIPIAFTQQVDVENIGKSIKNKIKQKNPFKISGGINANTIFYNGNAGSGRDPFSYFLNGNVNLGIYSINIPLSFSFTNSGFSYQYSFPRTPSRLSLHPKYKWVTGHIGDVSMTLSPYTLNGLLFRGAGIELSPKGKWKYSAMYGQLQKAVEYKPASRSSMASYKRMGYGARLQYDGGRYKAGVSLFSAKDDVASLRVPPDSLQVYPQQNTAVSFDAAFPLIKNLVLSSEYGLSALTSDVRSPMYADSSKINWLVKLAGGRLSTNVFKALKSQLNYIIGSSIIGIGYERIDPGYQTLGSYYFNNDLENITVNFAQSLFKGKLNFSGNAGIQKDDLENKKTGSSNRTVMAFTFNYNASQRFTSTFTYTNFQTFTNVKPQFQYINQLTPYDNLDTLDFKQLSQNSNLNVNYVLGRNKEKPQNLNLNFSFQDSYDMQGGVIGKGSASQFYNFAGSYNRANIARAINITGAFNITYNTIGTNNMLTLGPTIAVNKQLFKKKVRAGGSVSYNSTISNGSDQSRVMSMRINAGYMYKKKHLVNFITAAMMRNVKGKGAYDATATVSYNYNF